jgi:methanogenic corrinoid protein MtbC1
VYRWCSYCQHYLGEREPFDDHALTHGICRDCVARNALRDDEALERIKPIRNFYADVINITRASEPALVPLVVRRGLALNLRPVDLLMGILQPALYEVGRLWESGQLTFEQEASFTRFCEAALEELTMEQNRSRSLSHRPRVLLLNAEGNLHTIGIRLAAFVLREEGHNVQALVSTPPMEDLPELLRAQRPALVGVSLSLEQQLPYLDGLMKIVATLPERPRVVAGGYLVRAGVTLPPEVEPLADLGVLLRSWV